MIFLLSLLGLGAGLTNALSVRDLPEIPEVRHELKLIDSTPYISGRRPLGSPCSWQQWLVQLPAPGWRVSRLPDCPRPRRPGWPHHSHDVRRHRLRQGEPHPRNDHQSSKRDRCVQGGAQGLRVQRSQAGYIPQGKRKWIENVANLWFFTQIVRF